MQKLKKNAIEIIQILVLVPVLTYRLLTRKAYYITGTFLKQDGTRMFCKTVFYTRGNLLPITSIEEELARGFKVDRVVILFFQRITLAQARTIETDTRIEIDYQKSKP